MGIYSVALLAAPRQGASGGLVFAIQLLAIFVIFYFLLIRPQRKVQQRHQQMLAALKRGDQVMTEGGILGEVIHLAEDRVTLKTGESRVVVARAKIARVFTAEATEKK
ncbi:MAG TPA: preprotein translocase subunit YajC [Longimicrobiales bacterium]